MNNPAPAPTGPAGAVLPDAPSGPSPTLQDCIRMWHAANPEFVSVAECADPDTLIWASEATR